MSSKLTESTTDHMPEYSNYTLEQLYEVHDFMDREQYPDWFAVVEQEIEKRKSETKEKGETPETKTSTNRWQKTLAVTEILGGLILGGLTLLLVISDLPDILIFTIAVAIAVLAVVAGVALYKNTLLGKRLSIVLQALQVFSLSSAKFFYLLVAGLQLNVSWIYSADMLQKNGLNLGYGIYGTFLVGGPGHGQPLGIGVNFIALSALLLLVYDGKRPQPVQ